MPEGSPVAPAAARRAAREALRRRTVREPGCPCRSTGAARRSWRWWRARRGSSRPAGRPRTTSTSNRPSAPGLVASSSPRPSARGTGSSSHMSRIVSSMMVRVLVSAMMPANRFRSCAGIVKPGGILVVGDQIGQARRQLLDRGLQRVELPAVLGHRHGNGSRPGGGDGRQRAVIGGLFHQHAVAGLHVGRQDQADGMQRAGGHQDLVGFGGKATLAISFGDGLPQSATPTSSWPTWCRYGVTSCVASTNASLTAAAGADSAAAARLIDGAAASARDGRCDGKGSGAAGAAAGVEVAVLAQLGVRGGDGGAGDPQRVGHRPLARQPSADGNAPVDDQQPDRVGQARGRPGRYDWMCASCQARGPKGPHRALGRAFRPSFASQYALNWLLNSKPVGRILSVHEHELDI